MKKQISSIKLLSILGGFLFADTSFGELVLVRTEPEGASVFVNGKLVGITSQPIRLSDVEWTGEVIVHKSDFQALPIVRSDAAGVIRLKPYPRITSTGIPMVDVPIRDAENKVLYTVQFAVWETRTKDFESFITYVGSHPRLPHSKYVEAETASDYEKYRSSIADGEKLTPTHPVVCISKETVHAFCEWLTMTDRSKGLIPDDYAYRLPSDLEWSSAAIVKEDRNPDLSPFKREKTAVLTDICKYNGYPEYPLGNLKGKEYDRKGISHTGVLKVDDGYVKSCPVGQFAPNPFGIFDLIGNVHERCLDLKYDDAEVSWKPLSDDYVVRGPSYDRLSPDLAVRYTWMGDQVGFRLVLAQKDIVPYGYHGERPTMPYSKRLK